MLFSGGALWTKKAGSVGWGSWEEGPASPTHHREKWKEGMVRKGEHLRVAGAITGVRSVTPVLTHRHACTGALSTASPHDMGHEMLF